MPDSPRVFLWGAYLIILGVFCGCLAFEYSGCAFRYWGVGYFTPVDVFYNGKEIENLGVLYVGDAIAWWLASLTLLGLGIKRIKNFSGKLQNSSN